MDNNALMIQLLLDRQAEIERLREQVQTMAHVNTELQATLQGRDETVSDAARQIAALKAERDQRDDPPDGGVLAATPSPNDDGTGGAIIGSQL